MNGLGMSVRESDDGWVLPRLADCDQYDGGTGDTTPANPVGMGDVDITEVAPGVFDLQWRNDVWADGVRELAGVSWELGALIGGADYADPDQLFHTELVLVDLTGCDLSASTQLGFGVGRGTLGSGSEDGRIGGIGWASASAAAPTVRFTTSQAFSGTINLGTYPIDGAELLQIPARAAGAEPMFGHQVCSLFADSGDQRTHYRVNNAQYVNLSTTVAPAGTDRLFLQFGSAGAGAGSAVQTARVRLRTRRLAMRSRLDL